ncbi:MAG: DUF3737 family protein [Lachnospiraceae bacterium]|jgi:hypothetical protein|nr:DUF3737 family protein [Lachnospiraceae bacterium]
METERLEESGMHQIVKDQVLTGERALFMQRDTVVENVVFEDGESPLKESVHVEVKESIFKWKYPLWYGEGSSISQSLLLDGARAGIWYTNDITVRDTTIQSPKMFRRCRGINLERVDLPNAKETLWMCHDIKMNDVSAKGDYFAMNASGIRAIAYRLVGNYSFYGVKDVQIENSHLISKDAFWNAENVVVKDSFISGEYIGWNSKNLTFENCTIESHQGFCYIENLILRNCRLLTTDLAFEYCRELDVHVSSPIGSVKNPISGVIRAQAIGEVIFDDPAIDPSKTSIEIVNTQSE